MLDNSFDDNDKMELSTATLPNRTQTLTRISSLDGTKAVNGTSKNFNIAPLPAI